LRHPDFIEILLSVDKEEATRRLLKRGSWGEAGLPPITESDRPRIEALYEKMMTAVGKREATIRIQSKEGETDRTYSDFISAIGEK
jgi:hypothetical protein